MSLNKVMLIGNLGRDPELKYLDSGNAVCNFSIATSEKWKDKQGNPQERTEWHRIVAFGKTAENCARYLEKGRSVYVEGSIQSREYEKDGEKKRAYDIKAFSVQFLGGGSSSESTRPAPNPPASEPEKPGEFPDADSDLPF